MREEKREYCNHARPEISAKKIAPNLLLYAIWDNPEIMSAGEIALKQGRVSIWVYMRSDRHSVVDTICHYCLIPTTSGQFHNGNCAPKLPEYLKWGYFDCRRNSKIAPINAKPDTWGYFM